MSTMRRQVRSLMRRTIARGALGAAAALIDHGFTTYNRVHSAHLLPHDSSYGVTGNPLIKLPRIQRHHV